MGFTGWMKHQRRRIALSLSLRVKLLIAASEDQTEVEAFVLVSREAGICRRDGFAQPDSGYFSAPAHVAVKFAKREHHESMAYCTLLLRLHNR